MDIGDIVDFEADCLIAMVLGRESTLVKTRVRERLVDICCLMLLHTELTLVRT